MKTKACTDCLHPQSFHRVGVAMFAPSRVWKLRHGEGLPEPHGSVAELSDCRAAPRNLSPTAMPRFTPTFQFRACLAFLPHPGHLHCLPKAGRGVYETAEEI